MGVINLNVKNDFKMLDKSIVYFDSGATTFKPNKVLDSIVDYYTNYTANAHRGDYDISSLFSTYWILLFYFSN